MAAALAGEVGDLAADPLEVGELAADVLHQELAGGVQPHAAGQALEDLGAELGLEGLDAAVEGRGGEVEVLGGLADRPGAGDVLDQPQGLEVPHRLRTLGAHACASGQYTCYRHSNQNSFIQSQPSLTDCAGISAACNAAAPVNS